jgi:hypothetical protein
MFVKEKSNCTVEPVQPGDCSGLQPEFGRVPDCQRLFGIKRGILYRWIQERRIKTFLLREKGNKHGIRLIYLQSVRDYLYANMEHGDIKNEETALTA